MTKNAKLETNDDNKTGVICNESGTYCCKMHSYVEKYIHEEEPFPQCDQKGLPHNTTWWKIIE